VQIFEEVCTCTDGMYRLVAPPTFCCNDDSFALFLQSRFQSRLLVPLLVLVILFANARL